MGSFIARVLKDISKIKKEKDISQEQEKKLATRKDIISQSQEVNNVREEVRELCLSFPIIRE